MESADGFEWEETIDGVEPPKSLLNQDPVPKRPRGRPPKSSNGDAKEPDEALTNA
jgi:hypothetical protein